MKLQNSSPPPPHQKKNENNPQNCSSPSAARPRSFGCCQRERRRLGVSTRPTTGGRMSFQKVFPPGFLLVESPFCLVNEGYQEDKSVSWLEVLEMLEGQQYFCWRFKRLSHLGEHPAIWHLFAAVRIAPRWHGRSIPHGPTCPSASLGTSNFNPKKKTSTCQNASLGCSQPQSSTRSSGLKMDTSAPSQVDATHCAGDSCGVGF